MLIHEIPVVADAEFDDFTRFAAEICDTPLAMVTLIGEERPWYKSIWGIQRKEIPIEHSICAQNIEHGRFFEVCNLRTDERFGNHPWVKGSPDLRYYAGVPLRAPTGFGLGTLCVMDYQPRHLSSGQRKLLESLGRQLMHLLELRRTRDLLRAYEERIQVDSLVTVPSEDQFSLIEDPTISLEIAKSEMPLRKVTFSPADLLSDIREFAFPQARALGLEFRIQVEAGTPRWVEGSSDHIKKVLFNLIGNALRFTKCGSISAGVRFCGHVPSATGLEFYVEDTGPGIPAAKMNTIFAAFTQARSSSRRRIAHVGLTISRALAEMMGGSLQATRNCASNGTRFALQIPLRLADHLLLFLEQRPSIVLPT